MKNLVLLLLLFTSAPAHALSSADVTEKMSAEASSFYIGATVETIAFMSYAYGQAGASDCIMDWYFGTDDAVSKIMKYLRAFPEKTPQLVILAALERQCEKLVP